jgi:hypothetical protein
VFPADWVERLVDDDTRHGDLMPEDVLTGEALTVIDRERRPSVTAQVV